MEPGPGTERLTPRRIDRATWAAPPVGLLLMLLAGCATTPAAAPHPSGRAGTHVTAQVTGHVGLYGGPMNPRTGRMSLEDAPPGVVIVFVSTPGRPEIQVHTDPAGRFRLRLAPGRYLVRTRCAAPVSIRVRDGQERQLHLVCAVP